MFDKVFIDGVDIYAEYGVFISFEGNKDLLSYPPLKAPDTVDWPDEDGIEVDLSTPMLDARKVSIAFNVHARNGIVEANQSGLISMLQNGAYHTFEFRSLGLVKRLRLVSQPRLDLFMTLQFFTLEFSDDFSLLEEYSYLAPLNNYGVPLCGYEIDGVDFSQYSTIVLKGRSEVLKSPAVKPNLLINSNNRHGVIYDDNNVFFKSKDVTLKCFMRAKNINDFWRNYYALLFDLIRPNERVLYVEEFGEEYPCYYKSCKTDEFAVSNNKVWWEFSLTLCFTSFRNGDTEYILTSEDNEIIITEDGFAIDLK